jgi:hypothetical protein
MNITSADTNIQIAIAQHKLRELSRVADLFEEVVSETDHFASDDAEIISAALARAARHWEKKLAALRLQKRLLAAEAAPPTTGLQRLVADLGAEGPHLRAAYEKGKARGEAFVREQIALKSALPPQRPAPEDVQILRAARQRDPNWRGD